MKDIDAAGLAFVIHDGDFWWDGAAWTEKDGGLPPCSDEAFENRLALAQNSRHPFIFVPGDNEWADCYRGKPRAYDPFERLTKLRQTFFSGDHSLGRRTIRLKRQSKDPHYAEYRENMRWTYGASCSSPFTSSGATKPRTHPGNGRRTRGADGGQPSMDETIVRVAAATRAQVMIIAQADPRFENSWPTDMQQRYMLDGLGFQPPETRRATGFDGFVAALEQETLAFGKPVVYVHGDSHLFRIDKPLVGTRSRRTIENFTRVETFGFPYTHWVRARVDRDDPNVFRFTQEIVKDNLVKH